MVCSHVAHVGSALARLTRDCLAGRTGTAMYPDGRAEREATINRGRHEPPDELRRRLVAAETALGELWPSLDTSSWGRTRRDPELGTMLLTRLVMLRWTELEVHRTDLGIPGADPAWSEAWVAAALPLRLAWLGAHQRRASEVDGRWVLSATDLRRSWEVLASGTAVRVRELEESAAGGVDVDVDVDVAGPAAGVLAFVLGRRGPTVSCSAAAPALKQAFPGP